MNGQDDNLILNVDGPHDSAYTRQVANAASECIRVLNHATQSGGLQEPADVYDIDGNVHRLLALLPQLLTQTSGYLEAGLVAGRLYDDRRDRGPGKAVADRAGAVQTVISCLHEAELAMARAHACSSHLGLV